MFIIPQRLSRETCLFSMSALDYKLLLRQEREAFLRQALADSLPKFNEQAADASGARAKQVRNDRNSSYLPVVSQWTLSHILLQKVGDIPSISYGKDVIDDACEHQLMQCIQSMGTHQKAWRQLKARRLQCWGEFPQSTSGKAEDNLSEPMPAWLELLIDSLVQQGVFEESTRPNNVLINQYNPDEGILHHTDGPAYRDRVAIISLGSDTILSFRKKLSSDQIGVEFGGDVCSVVMKRRSMLVFENDAYNNYMHGIECGQAVQQVGAQGPCINVHLAELDPAVDCHSVRHSVLCASMA